MCPGPCSTPFLSREVCQHLLEEQTKLAEVDRELGERLMVFQSTDKVAHKLTSPTLSVQS